MRKQGGGEEGQSGHCCYPGYSDGGGTVGEMERLGVRNLSTNLNRKLVTVAILIQQIFHWSTISFDLVSAQLTVPRQGRSILLIDPPCLRKPFVFPAHSSSYCKADPLPVNLMPLFMQITEHVMGKISRNCDSSSEMGDLVETE